MFKQELMDKITESHNAFVDALKKHIDFKIEQHDLEINKFQRIICKIFRIPTHINVVVRKNNK